MTFPLLSSLLREQPASTIVCFKVEGRRLESP
jgi:hypothetical protein